MCLFTDVLKDDWDECEGQGEMQTKMINIIEIKENEESGNTNAVFFESGSVANLDSCFLYTFAIALLFHVMFWQNNLLTTCSDWHKFKLVQLYISVLHW